MEHPHEKFMKRAIELSRIAGEQKTGGIFGAVIVRNNAILSEGYNRVIEDHDATCHAEMDAIRQAGKKIGSYLLEGCILYTSAFCCPMCLCAAYWAHIKEIYYGATTEDTKKYGDFSDADYFEEMRKNLKDRSIKCTEFMRAEAIEVLEEFQKMPGHVKY